MDFTEISSGGELPKDEFPVEVIKCKIEKIYIDDLVIAELKSRYIPIPLEIFSGTTDKGIIAISIYSGLMHVNFGKTIMIEMDTFDVENKGFVHTDKAILDLLIANNIIKIVEDSNENNSGEQRD